jgi:hypothetical protein
MRLTAFKNIHSTKNFNVALFNKFYLISILIIFQYNLVKIYQNFDVGLNFIRKYR